MGQGRRGRTQEAPHWPAHDYNHLSATRRSCHHHLHIHASCIHHVSIAKSSTARFMTYITCHATPWPLRLSFPMRPPVHMCAVRATSSTPTPCACPALRWDLPPLPWLHSAICHAMFTVAVAVAVATRHRPCPCPMPPPPPRPSQRSRGRN